MKRDYILTKQGSLVQYQTKLMRSAYQEESVKRRCTIEVIPCGHLES